MKPHQPFNSLPHQNPIELSPSEWDEIVQVVDVREGWGLEPEDTPESFKSMVYAVKFKFVSGSPGYVGDLFILQGDSLGEPMRLIRQDGRLTCLESGD